MGGQTDRPCLVYPRTMNWEELVPRFYWHDFHMVTLLIRCPVLLKWEADPVLTRGSTPFGSWWVRQLPEGPNSASWEWHWGQLPPSCTESHTILLHMRHTFQSFLDYCLLLLFMQIDACYLHSYGPELSQVSGHILVHISRMYRWQWWLSVAMR